MRPGRTKNAPKSIRLGRAQIAPKEHYNCAQSTLHLFKTLTCAQGAPKMCLGSITPVENIHAQGHRLAPEAHEEILFGCARCASELRPRHIRSLALLPPTRKSFHRLIKKKEKKHFTTIASPLPTLKSYHLTTTTTPLPPPSPPPIPLPTPNHHLSTTSTINTPPPLYFITTHPLLLHHHHRPHFTLPSPPTHQHFTTTPPPYHRAHISPPSALYSHYLTTTNPLPPSFLHLLITYITLTSLPLLPHFHFHHCCHHNSIQPLPPTFINIHHLEHHKNTTPPPRLLYHHFTPIYPPSLPPPRLLTLYYHHQHNNKIRNIHK